MGYQSFSAIVYLGAYSCLPTAFYPVIFSHVVHSYATAPPAGCLYPPSTGCRPATAAPSTPPQAQIPPAASCGPQSTRPHGRVCAPQSAGTRLLGLSSPSRAPAACHGCFLRSGPSQRHCVLVAQSTRVQCTFPGSWSRKSPSIEPRRFLGPRSAHFPHYRRRRRAVDRLLRISR